MNRVNKAITAFLFLASSLAFAESVLPTDMKQISGDPARPTAGDVIELRVRLPEGSTGIKPSFADGIATGPVTLGKTGRVLWWKVDAQDPLVHTFGVTTYTPGEFEISPISFGDFETEPKKIKFESVGKGDGDIYPPLGASIPKWFVYAMIAVGLIFAALLGYAIYKWMKRRRALRDALKSAPKVLTPIEELEEVCNSAEVKKAIQDGKYKRAYFAVSEALKYYLSRVHKFNAEESTTRELLYELERVFTEKPFIERWTRLFEHMDVIKFTDTIPSENQLRSLPSEALQLGRDSWDAWQRTQIQVLPPTEKR